MADYNHQALAYLAQHRAISGHQLRQVSEHQAPQVALAEAALEAHLQWSQGRQPLQQHLVHQHRQ